MIGGPPSCKSKYITCPSEGGGPSTVNGVTGTYINDGGTQYSASNCQSFLSRTSTADIDQTTGFKPKGRCTSCTQQTTGVCSAIFLANVLRGDGIKHAYCNDKYLIITSDGSASLWKPNLDDVPFPPGGGSSQRTGMGSLDMTRADTLYYPLSVSDLTTSTGSNNVNVWDSASYLTDTSGNSFGLPADAGIGMGINGQDIFPVYNNRFEYTPAKCEVDSCNEHVGQGGGQPHWHGDPFSDEKEYTCLYGPSNYTSSESHPPVIGFANDGHLIYGRHLSESAPGFAAPLLDGCGGNKHTEAGIDANGIDLKATYHYHVQAFDATCTEANVCDTGDTYVATTTGPFQCFKADLTKSSGSSALLKATSSSSYAAKNEMEYRCCGMTDYYALTGQAFDAEDVAASSSCSVPAAPENGAYAADSACATVGASLQSGWACTATCNEGFCSAGSTKCVKGVITETSTCVASTDACSYTAAGAQAASETAGEGSVGSHNAVSNVIGVAITMVLCLVLLLF